MGLSEAMGITFRTAIRSSFSVVPKTCKIFWDSSLTREEKEAAFPAWLLTCRQWLYTMLRKCTRSLWAPGPTPAHTQQTWGLAASSPLGLCTHTDSSCLSITLPCSSHGKCVLQAPPGSFSEPLPGALCSCRNTGPRFQARWQHRPSQTPPTLMALHQTAFPAHRIPACHIPLPPQSSQNTYSKLHSQVILLGEQEPESTTQFKRAKYQESSVAPVSLFFLLYPPFFIWINIFNAIFIMSY